MKSQNLEETKNDQVCDATHETATVSKVCYAAPTHRVVRSEAGFTLTVDLPGVRKDSMEIELEKGVLKVEAQRQWQSPTGWKAYQSQAAERAAYRLQVELGDQIDCDQIVASSESGVLTFRLPLKEAEKPRRIEIS